MDGYDIWAQYVLPVLAFFKKPAPAPMFCNGLILRRGSFLPGTFFKEATDEVVEKVFTPIGLIEVEACDERLGVLESVFLWDVEDS
jgi:hypothetical protein